MEQKYQKNNEPFTMMVCAVIYIIDCLAKYQQQLTGIYL